MDLGQTSLNLQPALPAAVLTAIAAGAVAALLARWLCRAATPRRVGAAGAVAILVGAILILSSAATAAALLILAGAGVAWALASYAPQRRRLDPRLRLLLPGLRAAIVLAALAALARPTAVTARRRPALQGLAILLDASGSMAQPYDPHAPQGPSRFTAARSALNRNRRRLDDLARRYRLLIVGFDDQLVDAPVDRLAPDGEATAIGDAVAEATQRLRLGGVQPVGAIVLTDGANNAAGRYGPAEVTQRLAAEGAAIWWAPAAAERPDSYARASLGEIAAPRRADLRTELAAAVELDLARLGGEDVRVEWLWDNEVVDRDVIVGEDEPTSRTLRLRLTPREVGFHRLAVQVTPPQRPGRSVAGPTRRRTLVHVLHRKLRVLLVSGRRRHEERFIDRALAGDERIELTRLIVGDAWPRGWQDPARLERFDVFILADTAAARWGRAHQRRLAELVDAGRALAMIGGPGSFADGGWDATPLAAVLPVRMDLAGQIDEPVTIEPTAAAAEHPWMTLDDDGAGWRRLRPLSGASVLGAAKSTAAVLAEDARGRPMIVAGRYGGGRTLAIAFDSTWRWVLSPEPTERLQRRFWRQAVLWLADPQPDAWVGVDQPSYNRRRLESGESLIRVAAGLVGPDGSAAEGAEPGVRLIGPGGEATTVPMRRESPGQWTGQIGALPVGQWRLNLSAEIAGQAVSAEHRFEVSPGDRESAEPAADLALLHELARLAEPAGGALTTLERFETALEFFLAAEPPGYRTVSAEYDPLAEHPEALLLLIVAAAAAEWALRKKAALV